MTRHRIRTCRPWYVSPPLFWYLAGVAGLVAGGCLVKFAPDLARSLVEIFK